MVFWRHVAIVVWKDLRVELRTKEILYTMGFFAALVVLIFSLAFTKADGSPVGEVAGGILWVSVAFAGVLGLSRAFEREREGDTLRALLLAPSSRAALFLGKAIGVAALMAMVEVVVVPLVGLLFDAPVFENLGWLVLLLVLATTGIAVVGSVFALILGRSRMREVLLPVILYPVVMPCLIAGAKGTSALLEVDPNMDAAFLWIKVLIGIDVIFLAVALTFFESLVIE